METLVVLIPILQGIFGANLARAKCAAGIILALIKVRSVNLVQLALALPGNAKKESKYRRIQRFFSEIHIDNETVAKFIIAQLPLPKYTLLIDRTNWKFGKTYVNILFMAINYNGFTIPILSTMLPQSKKSGNTNTQERIELLQRFIKIFGISVIEFIVGDREFIGRAWFLYLIDNNINFRLRIKYNTKISRANGQYSKAKNLFRDLKPGEAKQLDGKRQVFGMELYVTGMKLPSGELLIIASYDSVSYTEMLNDYKKRWGIECLFKALKSQGFDFETTHLTDPKKIDTLIALMTIACMWACKTGQWLNNEKKIPIKEHGRKAISIFRYGLDYLREIFLDIEEKISQSLVVLGLIQMVSIPIKCVLSC